jgi:hypothetical protein
VGRAQTESGGKLIADAYGAEWKVRLGRQDSSEPGPAGKYPAPGASTAEIKAFMKQLGEGEGRGRKCVVYVRSNSGVCSAVL